MTRDPEQLLEWLLALEPAVCTALLRAMTAADQRDLERNWAAWSRVSQRPPPGDWRVWLMLAGRGFGKTRAGAEWVHSLACKRGKARIALVGATMDEARAIMVEGESGLLSLGSRKSRPKWEPSLGRLTWRSGAIAHIYSADNPDGLRGAHQRYAWCDELAKWGRGEEAWMNLQFGLREGPSQQVLVTTTPRPGALLRRLMGDPKTVRTGGSTIENLFLAPSYIEAVSASYAGTRLGRQEIDGELIEDVEGALWTRASLDCARDDRGSCDEPSFTRIVVGVDPPASISGACGIVAAGIDRAGTGHVLEDASVENASPDRWARAVAECAARWDAERVLAEANNGGDMVMATLRAHDARLPVRLVHASRGKAARAEPVALLYEQGRVTHRGRFPALEDQLCGMTPGGYVGPGRSPDRADALVWALSDLMLRRPAVVPRVWVF